MFGISGGEFIILIVVAIIFLGPKHAAQAVKALRGAMGYIRDFSSQLRSQISTQHAQSTLESLGITSEDLATLRELRATTGSLDPRAFVRKTVAEEMDAWLDMTPKTDGFPKSSYSQASTSTNTSVDSTSSTVSTNEDKSVESDSEKTQTSQESASLAEERKEL